MGNPGGVVYSGGLAGAIAAANAKRGELVTPDVPHCIVTPVANGYVVAVGAGFMGASYNGLAPDFTKIHVARNYAELCRVLKHLAVQAKMNPDTT